MSPDDTRECPSGDTRCQPLSSIPSHRTLNLNIHNFFIDHRFHLQSTFTSLSLFSLGNALFKQLYQATLRKTYQNNPEHVREETGKLLVVEQRLFE